MDENADFFLVAADDADAQQRLHALAADPRLSRYFLYRAAGRTIAFWPAGPLARELSTATDTLPCVRIAPVHGLARIVRTAKAATSLLDVLDPAGRPVTLDDGLLLMARQALRNQEVDLPARLEEALAPCTDAERERIKETVLAFLENGNVQATAGQLYCHRNTVLNRLSRFADLTGLDLSVPRQSAIAVLAWSELCPR